MNSGPRLVATLAPSNPEGLVLVLHGGAARRRHSTVNSVQLSVLRMIPIARRIARAGGGRIGVFRLLNSHRGWNESETPVMDARWALDRLADRYGAAVPVCLVGHSLGGRAALLVGGEQPVVAVVALNPWLDVADEANLHGRRILIVQGTDDRVAAPERTRIVAQRLAARADVRFLSIHGGKHAMLRHRGRFERCARDFAVAALLGEH